VVVFTGRRGDEDWTYDESQNGSLHEAIRLIDSDVSSIAHLTIREIPMTTAAARPVTHSFVLEHPAAEPDVAARHFRARLAVETDPSDVHADLERGVRRIFVVDARSPQHYAECHIPDAVNLPHRTITAESTAQLPPDVCLVVYCWGPGCNAATKGAARLSALGFQVKEMIGGLEYWRREGYQVTGTLGNEAPLYG
jgi:rhodanese-related sulfurtransferase